MARIPTLLIYEIVQGQEPIDSAQQLEGEYPLSYVNSLSLAISLILPTVLVGIAAIRAMTKTAGKLHPRIIIDV